MDIYLKRKEAIKKRSRVVSRPCNSKGKIDIVSSYFGVNTFSIGIFRAWLSLGDLTSALKLSAILVIFILAVGKIALKAIAPYANKALDDKIKECFKPIKNYIDYCRTWL